MPGLTGMPALDLAIGLAFILLLLSLLASTLQEFIAAFFGLRTRTLEQGLRHMLAGDENVLAAFYKHPLIDGLYRGQVTRGDLGKGGLRRTKGPSYVSPRSFAAFIVAAVAPEQGKLKPLQDCCRRDPGAARRCQGSATAAARRRRAKSSLGVRVDPRVRLRSARGTVGGARWSS